jgi:putative hydrolase of the HAD superfamily
MAQVPPDEVAYLDDRLMFVQVAGNLGIHGIHHTSYDSTVASLTALGLALEDHPGSLDLD